MNWQRWECPECGNKTDQPEKVEPKEVWCTKQDRHKRRKNRRMRKADA